MNTNNENSVVFAEDVETGTENNSSDDDAGEIVSQEFSTVGPLPSEIIASPTFTVMHSNNSGANRSRTSGSADMLKRRNYPRRPSKGAMSTASKGSKGGKTRSTYSTEGGSSGRSGFHSPTTNGTPRHVWYFRWLFFSLLCMIASALGYLTHSILTGNESYLAECIFAKVSNHAISTIQDKQTKKKLGMDSMGSVIGELLQQ